MVIRYLIALGLIFFVLWLVHKYTRPMKPTESGGRTHEDY